MTRRAKRKPGRPTWTPNPVPDKDGYTDVMKAIAAYEAGASKDDIAIGSFGIVPSTLYAYLNRNPDSELSKGLTRARSRARVILGMKAYQIAADNKHPRQTDMLKFWLRTQGGDGWKDKVAVSGDPEGVPIGVATTTVRDLLRKIGASRKRR